MEAFIIYLLKAAGISSIFYLLYFLLLKQETSFKLNRFFFLFGIFCSIALPLLKITHIVIVDAPTIVPGKEVNKILSRSNLTTEISYWTIALYIYLGGLLFFLSKMAFQVISLVQFLRKGNSITKDKFSFIETKEELQPFSFFHTIIYNPELHSSEELEMILQHEKAHGRQFHSIDVLLVNLFTAFLWFNPIVWLYSRSVVQNLEFLADRSTVAAEIPLKAYQKVLLKVSVGDLQPALVNSFYQSLIKKRILMLSKKTSQKTPFWKVSLILPLLAVFMFFFNIETKAQIKAKQEAFSFATQDGDHFNVAITSNSSQKELDAISQLAKEKGVELKFTKVKRNSEGLITSIDASFQEKGSNRSGSYSLSDEKGIDPFTFFYRKNGESGFRTATSGTATTFFRRTPGRIYTFQNERGDSLFAHTMTLKSDTLRFKNPKSRASRIVITRDSTKNDRRTFYLDRSSAVYYDKPLIVIDGKEMTASYNINDIEPETIEAIKILKGNNAVEKYGEEAKGGAIEITLKKNRK